MLEIRRCSSGGGRAARMTGIQIIFQITLEGFFRCCHRNSFFTETSKKSKRSRRVCFLCHPRRSFRRKSLWRGEKSDNRIIQQFPDKLLSLPAAQTSARRFAFAFVCWFNASEQTAIKTSRKAYWHIGANLKQCGGCYRTRTCVFISSGISICQSQLSNETKTH